VQAFEEVLDEDPDNRFAVLRSGIARLKQGRYDEAVVLLEKAVRLDPEQAEATFAYADALSRSGRLEPSIRYWQETVRLQPRREAAWSNLGTVSVQLGRWDEAIAAYRRAVAIEPEDPVLLRNLAIAERRGGRAAQAAEHFLAAAEIEGESSGQSASLGMILLELERIEEALPWLRRSRPGEAEFGAARVELARFELRSGRGEQARAALAEALSVDPGLAARLESDPELVGLLGSPAEE
jgi:tetratricopeptide (TPR) repeat protein